MSKSLRRRRIFLAGAAAGAVGLAGILSVSAFGFAKPLPSAGMKTSVLDLPAQADDRLPEGFEKLPIGKRVSDIAGARLAGSVGDQNYYIAPGKSSSICLIRTSGAGDNLRTSATCGARSSVNSTGIYLASGTPDSVSIAVIVPDGYQTAAAPGRQVKVVNNLALFDEGEPGTVTLRGPGLAEQRIDLGELAAPPRPAESQTVS